MARIALGITLALLLVTCFFGFQTRSKIQGLNDTVTTTKGQLATAEQNLTKAKADLKTAQDDTAKAKADTESAKAQLTTVQASLDEATKAKTDLTAQVTKLTADLDAAKKNPGPTAVANGPTPEDMAKLTAQLKDAQAQVAELNQVKETLSNKAKDAEGRSTELAKEVDHYKQGFMKNGLEGEVLAVNQGWNFVVLSIGDRQGAVTNAEMILMRGNQQIGKVRITSVEPSTSVADIVPGSLARGVRVQPGDRVIFPGT